MEGIRRAIASPQHELVGIPVRVECAVDRALSLELGIGPALVDHQPFIAVRVELKPGRVKFE